MSKDKNIYDLANKVEFYLQDIVEIPIDELSLKRIEKKVNR